MTDKGDQSPYLVSLSELAEMIKVGQQIYGTEGDSTSMERPGEKFDEDSSVQGEPMTDPEGQDQPLDVYGMTHVFATHLQVCLTHMHPIQAARAAAAAVEAYNASYKFINMSSKGERMPRYQMFPKDDQSPGAPPAARRSSSRKPE